VFAALSAAASAQSSETTIRLSTGLEYSSGDYGGTETIEDLYVPIIGSVSYGRLSFELTVPYLSVTAPAGTTITEPGGEPVSGSGPTLTESGLGDIIAGATLYDVFYSSDLGIALDLTGKIKFGTADEEKGLGTGEQDYTLRADLYKFFEKFTLMGSAGYKFRGEPADQDLENVFLGSIGGVFSPNDQSRFGVIYDYRESALLDGDAISELSAFLSRNLSDTWRLQFYAFTGFSDSSPDWGGGVLVSVN
jgi:hypothetical protein